MSLFALLLAFTQIGLFNGLIRQQLFSGAELGDGSGLQYISKVRHLQRHVGVLLDEQDGDAFLVNGADDVKDSLHHQRRQTQRRLIHHEDLGSVINARPVASICCSPPDRVPASWRRRSFIRGKWANTFSIFSAIGRIARLDSKNKLGLDIDWQFTGYPVRFWDVYGKMGLPVRTTISDMGPELLSRLLELNDTQSGVMNIVFRVADSQGLLLLDFKDLRSMVQYVGDHAAEIKMEYGNVSSQSIGAIQRALLRLEDQGGNIFGFNCVLMCIAAFLLGVAPALFTMICMYVNGTITDKVVAGFQRRKAVRIVSDQSQLIAEAILSELGRGVTFLHGQGAFTRKEKNIAMAVVNLTQIAKVKLIAHTIDPTAFMIIISANEVEGPGEILAVDEPHAELATRLPEKTGAARTSRDITVVLRPVDAVRIVRHRLLRVVEAEVRIDFADDDRNPLLEKDLVEKREDLAEALAEFFAVVVRILSLSADARPSCLLSLTDATPLAMIMATKMPTGSYQSALPHSQRISSMTRATSRMMIIGSVKPSRIFFQRGSGGICVSMFDPFFLLLSSTSAEVRPVLFMYSS